MSKTVELFERFVDPLQPTFGPVKRKLVISCDDGSIYEFQRHDDEPYWTMRAHGSKDEEPRRWTHSHARLPSDVRESLNEIVGKEEWRK